jgi:hypothetical protein
MRRLTQKQAADYFGFSKQYINKLVKQDRLKLVDGKFIDLDQASSTLQKKSIQFEDVDSELNRQKNLLMNFITHRVDEMFEDLSTLFYFTNKQV